MSVELTNKQKIEAYDKLKETLLDLASIGRTPSLCNACKYLSEIVSFKEISFLSQEIKNLCSSEYERKGYTYSITGIVKYRDYGFVWKITDTPIRVKWIEKQQKSLS